MSPVGVKCRWALTLDLGHAESSHGWGSEMIQDHGPQELLRGVPSAGRRLVRVHAGRDAARDRGRPGDLAGHLARWVEAYGTGKKTAADGTQRRSACRRAPRCRAPSRATESPEARIARLEAENAQLRAEKTKLDDRAGHPAPGGQVFRRGDALVNRFQFVADHRHAFEVKRLCEIVEVARSSFYAWLDGRARPGRSGPPPTRRWPSGSATIHDADNDLRRPADHRRAQRRRRPALASGSTTSGSPG